MGCPKAAELAGIISVWQTVVCSVGLRTCHGCHIRPGGPRIETNQMVLIFHEREILKIKIYTMKTKKYKKWQL